MGLSYILSSLFFNKILQYGDVVGIITPCSSSVLEIPMAETFSLAINCISMEKNGLISESELDKIRDPNMKVLITVNPSDIYGISISSIMIDKIQKIILEQNKNLLIIQDVSMAPYIDNMFCFYGPNVISIFSYSMFFGHGSTVIALPEHNIIDSVLLPNSMENFNIEKQLTDRYSPHNINISKIPFTDRIYLDAVFVSGRNRSYIVSSSEQLLLALYSVCNYKKYSKYIKNILRNRLIKLKLSLGIHDLPQEMYSMDVLPEDTPYYYMDLLDISTKIIGDSEFSRFISNNYNTYEFCFELASDTGVILLPGSVYNNNNKWGFRVPIVALTEDECTRLGMLLRNKIIELFDSYKEYVDKNDKLKFGIETK
jgi:aspartate 4-decarboxylase